MLAVRIPKSVKITQRNLPYEQRHPVYKGMSRRQYGRRFNMFGDNWDFIRHEVEGEWEEKKTPPVSTKPKSKRASKVTPGIQIVRLIKQN